MTSRPRPAGSRRAKPGFAPLSPLTAPGSPGPYPHTVPSGPARSATTQEREEAR